MRNFFFARNILVALVLVAIVSFSQGSIFEKTVQQRSPYLPIGWKDITPKKVAAKKYAKKSSANIKPTVVLIVSEKNNKDPKQYVTELIKGTKSVIPSLEITSDNSSEIEGLYTRIIVGTYMTGDQLVDIRQQISVQDNSVFTITASTDPTETKTLEKEILRIFNILHNTYITR